MRQILFALDPIYPSSYKADEGEEASAQELDILSKTELFKNVIPKAGPHSLAPVSSLWATLSHSVLCSALPLQTPSFLNHKWQGMTLTPQSQSVGYTVTCDLCDLASIDEPDLLEVIPLRIESKIQSHCPFYRFLKNMGPFFLIVIYVQNFGV